MIDIQPLIKAFKKFEEFSAHLDSEQEKAGAIQAFEYCYELSWKTMKRFLEERGKIANSPREAFRMAALEGFIDHPEHWFHFLKMRNITVHTYNEDNLEKVIEVFNLFSQELTLLISRIQT